MHLAEKQFWLCTPNDGEVLLFGKNTIQSPNSIVARKENQTSGITRKAIEIETSHLSTHIHLWLFRTLCDYDSLFPKSAVELEHSSTTDNESSRAPQCEELGNGQKFFS